MGRLYILCTAAALLGLLVTPSPWWTKAQEPEPIPPPAMEEDVPILEEEMDPEFMEILDLLEDSELVEILISDSDFLDVLEEFGEDIGIEEGDVPFELMAEKESFSDVDGAVEDGETFEDIGE